MNVGPSDIDALAGAGALRSTAADMLTYLEASLSNLTGIPDIERDLLSQNVVRYEDRVLLLDFAVAVRFGAVRLRGEAAQRDDRLAIAARHAGGPCMLGPILGLERRHLDLFMVIHHGFVYRGV